MKNMYQLTHEYLELYERLDSLEDETEIDAIIEQCDNIEDLIFSKLESLGCVCKQLAADAAEVKAEKDRLAKLQRTTENKLKRMKEYMFAIMQCNNISNFKGVRSSASIRNNAESVMIENLMEALGSGYIKDMQPDESWLDKTEIKRALQDGEAVPGCELIRTQSIVIK